MPPIPDATRKKFRSQQELQSELDGLLSEIESLNQIKESSLNKQSPGATSAVNKAFEAVSNRSGSTAASPIRSSESVDSIGQEDSSRSLAEGLARLRMTRARHLAQSKAANDVLSETDSRSPSSARDRDRDRDRSVSPVMFDRLVQNEDRNGEDEGYSNRMGTAAYRHSTSPARERVAASSSSSPSRSGRSTHLDHARLNSQVDISIARSNARRVVMPAPATVHTTAGGWRNAVMHTASDNNIHGTNNNTASVMSTFRTTEESIASVDREEFKRSISPTAAARMADKRREQRLARNATLNDSMASDLNSSLRDRNQMDLSTLNVNVSREDIEALQALQERERLLRVAEGSQKDAQPFEDFETLWEMHSRILSGENLEQSTDFENHAKTFSNQWDQLNEHEQGFISRVDPDLELERIRSPRLNASFRGALDNMRVTDTYNGPLSPQITSAFSPRKESNKPESKLNPSNTGSRRGNAADLGLVLEDDKGIGEVQELNSNQYESVFNQFFREESEIFGGITAKDMEEMQMLKKMVKGAEFLDCTKSSSEVPDRICLWVSSDFQRILWRDHGMKKSKGVIFVGPDLEIRQGRVVDVSQSSEAPQSIVINDESQEFSTLFTIRSPSVSIILDAESPQERWKWMTSLSCLLKPYTQTKINSDSTHPNPSESPVLGQGTVNSPVAGSRVDSADGIAFPDAVSQLPSLSLNPMVWNKHRRRRLSTALMFSEAKQMKIRLRMLQSTTQLQVVNTIKDSSEDPDIMARELKRCKERINELEDTLVETITELEVRRTVIEEMEKAILRRDIDSIRSLARSVPNMQRKSSYAGLSPAVFQKIQMQTKAHQNDIMKHYDNALSLSSSAGPSQQQSSSSLANAQLVVPNSLDALRRHYLPESDMIRQREESIQQGNYFTPQHNLDSNEQKLNKILRTDSRDRKLSAFGAAAERSTASPAVQTPGSVYSSSSSLFGHTRSTPTMGAVKPAGSDSRMRLPHSGSNTSVLSASGSVSAMSASMSDTRAASPRAKSPRQKSPVSSRSPSKRDLSPAAVRPVGGVYKFPRDVKEQKSANIGNTSATVEEIQKFRNERNKYWTQREETRRIVVPQALSPPSEF
eukprot:GILJ01009032.1.p1 GENE.GILJ01009032.1~~GILJ01009032.1.p1  ORF type:complete len:1103 (-),score=180.37 GILJ01009032.1:42-3350(-)